MFITLFFKCSIVKVRNKECICMYRVTRNNTGLSLAWAVLDAISGFSHFFIKNILVPFQRVNSFIKSYLKFGLR